jgi:hypothetical protein
MLTWLTISDSKIRGLTLVILAMFAVKSWIRRKEVLHPDSESDSKLSRLAGVSRSDSDDASPLAKS